MGHAHNNPLKEATSMLVFLCSHVTNYSQPLNALSIPVTALESSFLKTQLENCLTKINNTEYSITPIVIDGLGVNAKVARSLLAPMNDERYIALRRHSTSFIFENKACFILFCVVHILKCIRNNLLRKNNYFKYPALKLPDGHFIPAGYCDIKLVRQLHRDITKDKHALQDIHIARKVVYPDTLQRQQVHPTLILFSDRLCFALKRRYPIASEGTVHFLSLIDNYFIKPFFNISKSKYLRKQDIACAPFCDPKDIRLQCACAMADWVELWHRNIYNKEKIDVCDLMEDEIVTEEISIEDMAHCIVNETTILIESPIETPTPTQNDLPTTEETATIIPERLSEETATIIPERHVILRMKNCSKN